MDNSFLRFVDDFELAKDLQDCKVSTHIYSDQIHLKPNEDYSIITNVPNGIAFDNNYLAYIVDASGTVLNNITDYVLIEEFVSSIDGFNQMKIELLNIPFDYFTEHVQIKLVHDIVGGKSYWCNPFLMSEYDLNETTRWRFKHSKHLDGTDYTVANIFQSIRLKCYKEKNSFTSNLESYTDFDGIKYSSRMIKTKFYNFVFDRMNDFIYDRMQYLFSHDVIYVDGIRVTDKQTFDNADKFSNTTNVALNRFKVAINEDDIDNYGFQIAEVFDDVILIPAHNSTYSVSSFVTFLLSNLITVKFNKVISSLTLPGFSYKMYKNGVLVVDSSDATINSTNLELNDLQTYTFGAGSYRIEIGPNLVNSLSETWDGLNSTQWNFTISSGYYNKDYYNNVNFNTNP